MSHLRLIVFDVFKTLIDIQNDETAAGAWDLVAKWLAYHGARLTAQQLYDSYRSHEQKAFGDVPGELPDIDVGDVFRGILSDFPPAAGVDNAKLVVDTALLFRITTTTSLTVYPETVSVLTRLRESGKVRLAVASNTQRLFTTHELRRFGLDGFFDCIVFSSDVKACKPNPRLFQAVLDRMKTAPGNAIYVGDNPYDDVYGAQRAGLRVVRVDRGGQYAAPSGFQPPVPDRQILGSDFGSLPDVLFSMI